MVKQFFQKSFKNYQYFFKAQCKIFAVMAILFSLGLYIIGIDGAIWIGLGIVIFDLLPIVGSGMVFIPWSLFELLSQHQSLALKLALLYIITFILKQLIEPLFIGNHLSLPFYIPLFITLVCGSLFNIFGVLVAALIIPIVTTLYEMILLYQTSKSNHN